MKHSVLATMLLIGCGQAVQADTSTSKPATFMDQFSVHGTLTLSSDYRSRGFSKSDQKPSVQGGLILAHQSGAYLMLWGARCYYTEWWKHGGRRNLRLYMAD